MQQDSGGHTQRMVREGADRPGAGALPLRIMALVPDPDTCLSSLKIARAASVVDPDARLTALHVIADPARLLLSGDEELALMELQTLHWDNSQRWRDETFALYRDWQGRIGDGGGHITWRERSGDVATLVDAEAALADLVTIARPITSQGREALHAAIFAHRHLVLHTPPLAQDAQPRIGQIMAIAWRPTEATRRAIFRTARWLTGAEAVHLIAVEREDFEEGVAALDDLGIDVQFHQIARNAAGVGASILAHAHELGADSLVMGAYRRGAALSWLLRGATHDVLTQGDIPVFLVH